MSARTLTHWHEIEKKFLKIIKKRPAFFRVSTEYLHSHERTRPLAKDCEANRWQQSNVRFTLLDKLGNRRHFSNNELDFLQRALLFCGFLMRTGVVRRRCIASRRLIFSQRDTRTFRGFRLFHAAKIRFDPFACTQFAVPVDVAIFQIFLSDCST